MDPRFAPEPSSHSHYSASNPNYNEQAHAEALLGNIQSNGSEDLNTRESSLHPSHLSPLYDSGPEYRTIIYPAPNVPNHQLRLCDRSFLPLEGLTHDQVPVLPFLTDRNDADALHTASTQYPYPASLRGTNLQMTQAEIENHHPPSPLRDIYETSGVSASPESSSAMIAGTSSSSSTELYAQSGMQDDYVGAKSFPHEQVDGTTRSLAATQRQSTTMQKALRKRQQKQRKRVRDMERKREQRSGDDQYFAMICELLDIKLSPKNTLVRRILGCVGELVEQRQLDDDLRRQLVTGEADFTGELDQPSAATDTCSSLPLNEHSALDGSDTGATPHSWPWSNEEWDERHN